MRVKGPFELHRCLSPCPAIYVQRVQVLGETVRGCAAEKEVAQER